MQCVSYIKITINEYLKETFVFNLSKLLQNTNQNFWLPKNMENSGHNVFF